MIQWAMFNANTATKEHQMTASITNYVYAYADVQQNEGCATDAEMRRSYSRLNTAYRAVVRIGDRRLRKHGQVCGIENFVLKQRLHGYVPTIRDDEELADIYDIVAEAHRLPRRAFRG